MRHLTRIAPALLMCALPACGDNAAAVASATAMCADCIMADRCCAAHTANPGGNCHLQADCELAAGDNRQVVLDGCRHYVMVASTPPAPAACGPHPDAE